MGRRGPKPQPTALKIERGNPGKRALNPNEPVMDAPTAEQRKAPADLTGSAKEEWEALVEVLTAKGVLTAVDLRHFKEYCWTVGEVDRYRDLMTEVGDEEAHRIGYKGYFLKVSARMTQLSDRFGLTPSTRSSITAVKPPAAADTKRARFFGTEKKA